MSEDFYDVNKYPNIAAKKNAKSSGGTSATTDPTKAMPYLEDELRRIKGELNKFLGDENGIKTKSGPSGAPDAYREGEACKAVLAQIANKLQNEHDVYTSIACGN
jgi:hypothetical protein